MDSDIFPIEKRNAFLRVNNDAGMEVFFCTFGASIYSIKIDGIPLTVAPKNFDDFFYSDHYYGKTIGRICGRVKEGKLVIDGKTYQMEQNEGANALHSGADSLAFSRFNYSIAKKKTGIIVTFVFRSKNKENGLNGRVDYQIVYKIPKDENRLIIEMSATPNQNTYINLTNHTYWNLGEENILDHQLRLSAHRVADLDEDLLYKGIVDAPYAMDFSAKKAVGRDIHDPILHAKKLNGYDTFFVLDEERKEEEPDIELESSQFLLKGKTNSKSVLIYSNGYPTGDVLESGGTDTMFKAMTLEFTDPTPAYVEKNQTYFRKTVLSFERKSA